MTVYRIKLFTQKEGIHKGKRHQKKCLGGKHQA